MSEATPYTHAQARLDIEMALDGLLSSGQQENLHAHLLTCAECRAYHEKFISLERTLGEMFKATLPEVNYSHAETQQFSGEVKARYARRPRFNSPQWANSLAWVGAVALMMVGLAWILSNTRFESAPPHRIASFRCPLPRNPSGHLPHPAWEWTASQPSRLLH